MKNNLKQILNICSPSGYTMKITKYLEKKLEEMGFTVKYTKKGSLYVYIDSNKKETICLTSHIDTLGFMIKSLNDDGTLGLSNIGGPIVSTVNGEYCTIFTRNNKEFRGTILDKNRAIHVHKKASDKNIIDNLIVRVDEKVNSKQDLLDLGLNIGNYVCYDSKVEFVGDYVKSRFLDDKAGVVALLELLQNLDTSNLNKNLLVYFSIYEEVGHGGSSLPIDVDEFIAVDMGCIGENLNGSEEKVSICVKDSSGPYDYEITSKMIEIAEEIVIPYAIDVYPMYSSDGSCFLRGGNDAKVALVGPGVDASHGMERTTITAIKNTSKLLLTYLYKN
ncbi:MAG: M42 family metallopeptidase [Bacilli bacterium]